MRSVEEHQRVVDALLPDLPTESRELADALGLVLAEDAAAPIDLPPFDNSAMDGYAVTAADVASLPVTLPVAADLPAGVRVLNPLRAGQAVRIMTGAPIPPGAEVIVPVELTDRGAWTVRIDRAPDPGVHFRHRGEDATAGSVVLTKGTVLGPPQLGLAAALGLRRLAVRRPARLLVLSTGSELVAAGQPLLPGQIYESNSMLLASAIRAAGATATVASFVPDDIDQFLATLRSAVGTVYLVVTTGGVSAGAYEVVKDALTGAGVEFVSVAMQPGGPQGAGSFEGLPIVTFPGNPVSAFVSFEVFLRPALRRAMGYRTTTRSRRRLPVAADLTSPAGKRQFRRAVIDASAGTVRPWGGPGSHLLSWLAGADAMLVLPEDVTALSAGDIAEIWALNEDSFS